VGKDREGRREGRGGGREGKGMETKGEEDEES
jgi:hypothetical protein